VNIPGAYDQKEPGIVLDVWGKPAEHKKYVIPGPQLYHDKYEAPIGSPTIVTDTGALPANLEKGTRS
jgi:hypothetical protein